MSVEPDRITQVLVNLLTNATEYCPEGSTIKVTASAVGSEVEIAVSDDGPGIPARTSVEHVFDRFTRGEAGLTQRVGGTGLGLAIAKSLIELHGGAIGVTSKEGEGATFRIVLPALPDREAVEEPAAAAARLTRVLVADDSETILLLMRTRLEMEGYEVLTAADGQEAIEALAAAGEDGKPDVILLDAMMPRMSGLDVLRTLRDEGSKTPVLIVSAHREVETLSQAEGLGANGCVAKPIDFEDLLGRIARLTGDEAPNGTD